MDTNSVDNTYSRLRYRDNMSEQYISMRISMRSKHRYKIDEKSIQSVPDVDCFIEPEINKIITLGCKEVLKESYNSKTHQHGECALLISTLKTDMYGNRLEDIHKIIHGNHNRINLDIGTTNILNNRETKDLIIIHNHPSNGTFSYMDLRTLSLTQSLLGMVVIGNSRNTFIIIDDGIGNKIVNYVENKYNTYIKNNKQINISNMQEKTIKDKIVIADILTNPNKFSIVYERYNRRSL